MRKLLEAWRTLDGMILLTDVRGGLYVGSMVGLEIDEEEDCILIKTERGTVESFYEGEVASIELWTGKFKTIGKVRYVGNYYKIAFERGRTYGLLEITGRGFYKVYSDVIGDWALLPPQDCEII